MRAEPAPAKAITPRREIVGGSGRVATRYTGVPGSGRVPARFVRISPIRLRLRSARIMTGSLSAVWTTKPAMNTQAP